MSSLHRRTISAYTEHVRKLFTAILLGLASLMAVFVVISILHLLIPERVPCLGVRLGASWNESLILFHAIIFALICLVLLGLLLLSIFILGREERRHAGLSRLYDSVFCQMTSGLLVVNTAREIKYMNPAAARILERENRDLLVNRQYTILLDPVLAPVAERLEKAISGGEDMHAEYRVILSTGFISVRVAVSHFEDKDLGQVSVIAIEDKTAESDAKRKLSQQLEETRRYALSKDNFFANMSHEIRTPINAILGMTYFLKKLVRGERAAEYVQKIEHSSEILLGVVNDILDFAKMREHKFTLKPENFNLEGIKGILEDLFALKAVQRGVSLVLDFRMSPDFMVCADQFRLTQIFMNLIGNALKFTEEGSIIVTVSPEFDERGRIILRSSILDTGCGLSEESISKLFTDFEQFGEVLLKRHEGTGLGLAICKRLVELMNGVIWVDSTLGVGSNFQFVVILDPPRDMAVNSVSPASLVVQRRTGIILLVEDNEINAEIAAELLKEMEYTVELAEDGVQALEMARMVSPDYYDAILMDIHMPRLNGYDTARLLRTEVAVNCPIIAVSATTEEENRLSGDHSLFDGYIVKPYSHILLRALFDDSYAFDPKEET